MTCPSGKVFSNCSNICDITCETLSCSDKCNEPETCVPGCVCPTGTVANSNGECVAPKECQCKYKSQVIMDNQIIEDDLNCKKM